jgi:predicted nucleic acid-binding protein
LYLASITIGELRRGVDLIRRRGDAARADALEQWLAVLLETYGDRVLVLDAEAAQLWGRLRVPHPEHALDKQIAAIALLHDLTVVTRNTADFLPTGVALLNPFREPTEPAP